MARFCIDCGADISDLPPRTTLCLACKKKHAQESRKANREKRRAAKVCPLCGKSLAGQIGQRLYCKDCRPYTKSSKAEEPAERREARIAAKLAAEKERTAKVLDEIMNGKTDPRNRVDETVEKSIDAYTGYSVAWRGVKVCGSKACDVKHKNW